VTLAAPLKGRPTDQSSSRPSAGSSAAGTNLAYNALDVHVHLQAAAITPP
jgi:hypothetical protein